MLDLVTSPLAEKYATKIPLILSNIQFPEFLSKRARYLFQV